MSFLGKPRREIKRIRYQVGTKSVCTDVRCWREGQFKVLGSEEDIISKKILVV